MAKSKQVSVSKAKMADAGAALEAVGVVAAVDGAAGMVDGAEDLAVAKVGARVGVVAVAAVGNKDDDYNLSDIRQSTLLLTMTLVRPYFSTA